ncbi:hypothetical protein Sta7437_2943 [Stanieria cyanosphaera PCC 7437]|uniref:Uncharacterized protein n=1 Tax=Stanieria cyanosphaera (strain ATCC 29371 / PCC 7437) TaxID=111780 RepID=K9XXS6_STAC7|nr:hypothetical protein [Stanieria cyanosphaera]AFZ36462.1 hypothetical protein Sta7437_2943 [Stanieria cyanosphaera PCC 7437]
MANILTKNGVFKIFIWLTAEIFLNLIGLDDLADYSEFIFEHKLKIVQIIIAPSLPKTANHSLFIAPAINNSLF